jgi:PTS system nitrogen regulatory IIA component
MKIMDIVVQDAVLLELAPGDKREVLAQLARGLAGAVPELEADRLLQVLLDRESLQSTGIGEGVAIPHGKFPGLDRLLASFARSTPGTDFEAVDGQPTHLFFLLVVPEHSGGQHLKALARISRFFRDASFRKRLMEATSVEEVFQAIGEEDAKF